MAMSCCQYATSVHPQKCSLLRGQGPGWVGVGFRKRTEAEPEQHVPTEGNYKINLDSCQNQELVIPPVIRKRTEDHGWPIGGSWVAFSSQIGLTVVRILSASNFSV